MIAQLSGILALKSAEKIVIDVQGVGYEITCPLTIIERLPTQGESCQLVIKTYVREDQITLFGFSSFEERRLFEMLTSVSGIGPRLGIACLSGMDATGLKESIITGNIKRLSSIPGIGKKTAERMVLELRVKFEKSFVIDQVKPDQIPLIEDLTSALLNLGYKQKEIDQYLEGLGDEAAQCTFEDLLKGALSAFTF